MTTNSLPKNLRERFSQELKLLRIKHSLSQTQLAERMGVHRTMVSQVERGVLNFGLDTYEKALKAFAGIPYSNDSQTIRNEVGRRLRAFRESKSISQEALGEEAGFSVSYIGRVERGDKSTSVDQLERLSEILGIKADELIDEPSKALASLMNS